MQGELVYDADTMDERERYLQLLTAALSASLVKESDVTSAELNRLLRLLVSSDDRGLEHELAGWLKDAI